MYFYEVLHKYRQANKNCRLVVNCHLPYSFWLTGVFALWMFQVIGYFCYNRVDHVVSSFSRLLGPLNDSLHNLHNLRRCLDLLVPHLLPETFSCNITTLYTPDLTQLF